MSESKWMGMNPQGVGSPMGIQKVPFGKVVRTILELLRPHWFLWLGIVALGLLSSQADLLWRARLGSLEQDSAHLLPELRLIALVGTSALVLGPAYSVAAAYLEARMVLSVQQRLHDQYLALGVDFHHRWNPGQLIQAALRYPMSLQGVATALFIQPFLYLSTLIGAFFHLIRGLERNPEVLPALLPILGSVMLGLPVLGWWMGEQVRNLSTNVRDGHGEVANQFSKSLSDPVGLMLANANASRKFSMAGALGHLLPLQQRASRMFSIANALPGGVSLVVKLSVLVVMLVVVKGRFQLAFSAMLLADIGSSTISSLIAVLTSVKQSLPEVEAIVTIFGESPSVLESRAPVLEIPSSPTIVLDHVAFTYPGSRAQVLHDLCLKVPGGKVFGLVGRAGFGKSTILRLLGRVWDVSAGSISIGGTDIRELSWGALRGFRSVGRCAQEPTFLAESVLDNFRLFVPDISLAEAEEACRTVGILPVLERHSPSNPLGMVMTPKATQGGLSGGERKRLELARAISGNPKVLLLDEPAAGLSNKEDMAELVAALKAAKVGRTCILVEHNQDLIQAVADEVALIEDGRIVESGPIAELLTRPSRYRGFCEEPVTSDPPGLLTNPAEQKQRDTHD